MCFVTGATELGLTGAMKLPCEALASLWWWEGRDPPSKHCALQHKQLVELFYIRTRIAIERVLLTSVDVTELDAKRKI
jgi:hypothetical protein